VIYIHIPFCKSFCIYCGFYSEICSEKVQNLFVNRLIKEIDDRREEITASIGVRTLYFGGGTPSVLSIDSLERIVSYLDCGPYEEFTLEVNPEDIVSKGMDYLSRLRSIGVNRISMGVQSFDDGILRWMGRRHDASRAKHAFRMLRESGFDNISIDLIFGLSQLSDEIWKDTLAEVLALRPEHISAYQLSIEEGSTLCEMLSDGRYMEADEDKCRRQYDMLCMILHDAGYHHYEISNFALPGKEAVHNSAYWRRVPYVGLGPGAHSLHGENVRGWNTTDILDWSFEEEHLSPKEIREEIIMLGMRTEAGYEGHRISESDWFIADSIIAEII